MAKPGACLLVPQKVDSSELFIGSQRKFDAPAEGWAALRQDKLLSKLSPAMPLDRAAQKWHEYRQERISRVQKITDEMTVRRLPEVVRAKPPPRQFDDQVNSGGEGHLDWLYLPDLAAEAKKCVIEIEKEG